MKRQILFVLRFLETIRWDRAGVVVGALVAMDHAGPEPAKSIPAIEPSAAPASQPPVTAVVSSK